MNYENERTRIYRKDWNIIAVVYLLCFSFCDAIFSQWWVDQGWSNFGFFFANIFVAIFAATAFFHSIKGNYEIVIPQSPIEGIYVSAAKKPCKCQEKNVPESQTI